MDLLCNIITFYIYILLYVFININEDETAKRLGEIYRFLYSRACGCCPRGAYGIHRAMLLFRMAVSAFKNKGCLL